jgi:hypothetical protein
MNPTSWDADEDSGSLWVGHPRIARWLIGHPRVLWAILKLLRRV